MKITVINQIIVEDNGKMNEFSIGDHVKIVTHAGTELDGSIIKLKSKSLILMDKFSRGYFEFNIKYKDIEKINHN